MLRGIGISFFPQAINQSRATHIAKLMIEANVIDDAYLSTDKK